MDSLPSDGYLKFYPDTLSYIRSQYNLDKPGEMDRAIDSLEQWLLQQNHFTVKQFPRSYLERQIILDKGSVERAKKQMEQLFTMKTISTDLLGKYDAKVGFEGINSVFQHTLLPKLTKDYYRVYVAKVIHKDYSSDAISKAMEFSSIILEYIRAFEYCNGYLAILDYRGIDLLKLVASINLSELRQMIQYIMEGYQMRLKGLHIITNSKTVDVILKILRQMFSAKIGQRIHVHTTIDTLYEFIPKEILPNEFGGYERSLSDMCDEFTQELGKEENVEYFKEMGKAVVDESFRVGHKMTQDDILGISGSFRTISVD